MKIVLFGLRLLLALIFAVAGFMKLMEPPEEFAAVINNYQIVSTTAALALAHLLPWIELICGSFLAFGYVTRASAAILGSLSIIFLAALACAQIRGIDLQSCGCFASIGSHLTPIKAMILDSVLLLCASVTWKKYKQPYTIDAFLVK